MRRNKIIFSILCLIISFLIMAESYRLHLGSLSAPGAGFWPFVTGILFMGFSLAYMIRVLISEDNTSTTSRRDLKWGKPLITMALLLLYAMLLERIGFLLTTFIVMLILFRVDKRVEKAYKWIFLVGGAVLTSIAMYVIFALWLKVGLPRGPWGF